MKHPLAGIIRQSESCPDYFTGLRRPRVTPNETIKTPPSPNRNICPSQTKWQTTDTRRDETSVQSGTPASTPFCFRSAIKPTCSLDVFCTQAIAYTESTSTLTLFSSSTRSQNRASAHSDRRSSPPLICWFR